MAFAARASIFATLFSLMVVPPLYAQAPADTSAIYTLEVNRIPRGDVIVVVRGEDVLIPWQDLLNAGLTDVGGSREIIDGIEHVSLQSLAPAIRFERDDAALVLRLQVTAELLPENVIDFNPNNAPPGIRYSQPLSAYLNYGLFWNNFETLTVGAEMAVSFGGHALTSTLGLSADGQVQRGLTALTFDSRRHLTTLTLGDSLVSTDLLGGGGLWGGIRWERNFGLSPYLIRQPAMDLQGKLATPGTAEIYINGFLVRRLSLPPGPFILKNLPFSGGFNRVRVVVTDAEGKQQVFRRRYVQSARLLRPGLSEFIVAAGVERQGLGTDNFNYDDKVQMVAAYRQGILSNLTLGGRIEANADLVNGGLNVSTALPIGTLDLAAALSSTEGKLGSAVAVAYSYPRAIAFGGGVRLRSRDYVTTSLGLGSDRSLLDGFASTTFNLGPRINISAQYVFNNPRDQQASVLAQVRLRRDLSLLLQGSRSFFGDQAPVDQFSITFNYFLNNQVNLNTGWVQRGNQGVRFVNVSRSLPPGVGYGYQGQVSQVNEVGLASGVFQYNAPWGRYQVGYSHAGDSGQAAFGLEGGIVAIGGEVFATRPVQGSFALVEVPNVPGVRTYLSNQEIGRTNRRGKILIPDLLPYYGNDLRIEDQDIPLDFAIGQTQQLIAPPFRGGAIARFDVRRSRNYVGRALLVRGERRIIPSLGQLTLRQGDQTYVSPLTNNGEFYFDTLEAGTYAAELAYEQVRCAFRVTLPETDDLFTDLGELVCQLPD